MNFQQCTKEHEGFYGAYYPNNSSKGIILSLGTSGNQIKGGFIKAWVRWLLKRQCNVLVVAQGRTGNGYHNFPIETFERACKYMKDKGNIKLGIMGASTTAVIALAAASYYSDIELTIAFSPADFIMEGYYQDGLDGVKERPGNNESLLTYKGQGLPYLPYAYRHPEYNQKMIQEAKETGNLVAMRHCFERAEEIHPIQDAEFIKVENIKGKLLLFGAEDDSMWDSAKYIQRIVNRIEKSDSSCEVNNFIYQHGTHFIFPQGVCDMVLPLISGFVIGIVFSQGRKFKKECKETRIDIDKRLTEVLLKW